MAYLLQLDGRWTQQDPLAQPSSPTEEGLYQGFGGDPVNLSDPTGEPGVPAGYQCDDTEGSAQYREEHPRICAEIAATEGEAEEITGDLCSAADIANPEALELVKHACEIKDDVTHFVEAYELVFG